jgi:transposase
MKRTPGKTIAAKEKYWEKIIVAARRFPKGVTEYCRVMNVSKNNYYFWFKRLRPKHADWHDLTNRPEIPLQPAPLKTLPKAPQRVENLASDDRPDTEVPVRTSRKKWSSTERKRVLEETDGLSGPDLAAALRREGLFVHTLNAWRTQRDLLKIATETNIKSRVNPLTSENRKLKEENAKLLKKLQKATEIIDLQKKISEVLGIALAANDES